MQVPLWDLAARYMKLRAALRMGLPVLALLAWLAGCQAPPLHFPAQPLPSGGAGALRAYDADGAGRANFFLFADGAGRINRLGYDLSGQGQADAVVDLDAIPFQRCRHLVIILDGFGYDVVKSFYDAGGLRMFYPPSRVIAPYPTLTDTSLVDVFGYLPCAGYEAEYFDHAANRLVDGTGRYMAGESMPYDRLLQYRAALLWDSVSYLKPWPVFDMELNDVVTSFNKDLTQEFIAYFVSSAAVGTREGAAGQERCLARVEQLINQALWQTHGLVKVTMLADHGHSYTPSRLATFDGFLKQKGWHTQDKLTADRDVVCVRFGLLTYAAFDTRQPALLAADLVGGEGVDLVSYAEGDTVVVLGAAGAKATIRRQGERYSYQMASGDPLQLKDALSKLHPDADGYYSADELLTATADLEYPAALERLWRAHFGLVENPADVLCSLKDGYYCGAGGFAGMVQVASTHGSLNRKNGTTFVMSTIGPLPPLLRSAEVHAALGKLIGGPWPLKK